MDLDLEDTNLNSDIPGSEYADYSPLSRAGGFASGYDYAMPPSSSYYGEQPEIGIIKGLSPDKVLERIEYRLRGYSWNAGKKEWYKIRDPIMNEEGIQNIIQILASVSEVVTMSNFDKTEIPILVYEVIRKNLPYFFVYSEEYQLRPNDFNIISTTLLTFTLASFKKAQGAGDRNVIRGTLSENILMRQASTQGPPQGERSMGAVGKMMPWNWGKGR